MDVLDELDQLINVELEELQTVKPPSEQNDRHESHSTDGFTLDENFNLVDSDGNLVKTQKPTSEFLVNQANEKKAKRKLLKAKVQKIHQQNFYDPTIGTGGMTRKRKRSTFKFYEKGTFIREAKRARTQQMIDSHHKTVMKSLPGTDTEISHNPLGTDLEFGDCQLRVGLDGVPVLEPWDHKLVKSYDDPLDFDNDRDLRVKLNGRLVEHPTETAPNYRIRDNVPLPIMLTKKEEKKLRKQKRIQAEMLRQKKIRVGLLPPPAPKANLKNFMRVYLNDGTQNPTKLEKQIRKEVNDRVEAHEQRNRDNKLTSDERYEKRVTKNDQDMQEEIMCHVYKIRDLSHPYHRFKINALAYKFLVSGIVFETPKDIDNDVSVNMVVIEGGRKNIRRFDNKISRVEWNLTLEGNEKIDFESEEYKNKVPNKMKLMWRGTLKKKKFRGFKFVKFEDKDECIEYIRDRKITNYFNMCKNWMDY